MVRINDNAGMHKLTHILLHGDFSFFIISQTPFLNLIASFISQKEDNRQTRFGFLKSFFPK